MGSEPMRLADAWRYEPGEEADTHICENPGCANVVTPSVGFDGAVYIPDVCEECRSKQYVRKEPLLGRVDGVPPLFADSVFASWVAGENRKAKEAAVAWSRSAGHDGILIWGPSATGKTMLAVAAAREKAATMRVTGVMVNMATLFEEIKLGYRRGDHESPLYDKARSAKLAILDDLTPGPIRINEWSLERLYTLINYRYEHLLPTIVTTELQPSEEPDRDQLSKAFGERIASRLWVMCGVKVGLCGASQRRRRA